MPDVNIGDFVSVKNNEPQDIVLQYGKRYIIKAGKTGMVPFECAKLWYGDPRSMESKMRLTIGPPEAGVFEWIPSRREEIERLAILYGVYNANKLTGTGRGTENAGILDNMMDVTVTTLDGDEIVFPCSDPDGTKTLPQNSDDSGNAYLMRRMAQMQNQMLAMQQELEARGNGGKVLLGGEDDPTAIAGAPDDTEEVLAADESADTRDGAGDPDEVMEDAPTSAPRTPRLSIPIR